MTGFVKLSREPDGIAVLTINRPKVNALSTAVLHEIGDIFDGLRDDLPSAVVIWGGDKFFSAGSDVEEMGSAENARSISSAFHNSLGAIEAFPRIVIAAIAGYALGGGCELALACDFRVATAAAKLGFPEITLGIIPGGGGTQRLPRLVGSANARQLLLSGKHIDAVEARGIGLVDRVVDNDSLYNETLSWAREFAQGAVVAQGLIKRVVHDGLNGSLDSGLAIEADAFSDVFGTQDAQEGLRRFKESGPGKAHFSGR